MRGLAAAQGWETPLPFSFNCSQMGFFIFFIFV